MAKLQILCILAFVQFVCRTNSQFVGRRCIISNSIEGECLSIYNCPVVLAAFNQRPLSRQVVENMRRIQCGFDGFTPLVCCSEFLNLDDTTSNTITEPTRRPTRPPTTPSPPPISTGGGELPTKGVCGRGTLTDKIYQGQVTEIDEFPWMVLLRYRTANRTRVFQCGGALINDRYVLTAAHCIVGQITTVVGRLESVRLGEYDVQTDPDCVGTGVNEECAPVHQDIVVDRAIAHPGFSDSNVNRKDDIGLLRLARRVQYTDYVKPICLPYSPSGRDLSTGEGVYVAGWGRTLTARSSNVKLKLIVPVFDRDRCQELYATINVILTPNQLCAGGEFAKDTCRGDSGGPLMKEAEPGYWTVVGVVSFGNACGMDGWPGIYTKTANYMDWIRENISP